MAVTAHHRIAALQRFGIAQRGARPVEIAAIDIAGPNIDPEAKLDAAQSPALSAVERLAPGIRACPFGHMGDGNIHFNFSQPEGVDGKAFMAATEERAHEAIYEVVLALGGSVSAEHGIGRMKVGELERFAAPEKLAMMRAIKAALDPAGILNPGAVLRGTT